MIGSRGGKDAKLGSNDPEAACADACAQHLERREEVCVAVAERERAERGVRTAKRLFDASVALAFLMFGVAIVVAMVGGLLVMVGISWLAVPIATVALAALGISIAAAVATYGALVGAEGKLARASDVESEARAARKAAASILRDRCPAADADQCMSRPIDC